MNNVLPVRHAHKYVILVIVLVGVLMYVLNGIVVSIALPTITGAFNVDLSSSLLLPLLLRFSGSTVNVLRADKSALAASVGDIMLVCGVVCLLTVAILARSRTAAPAANASPSGTRAS